MLPDLQQLMEHARPELTVPDYRRLIVQENVLGKPTRTTREHTIRKLKALYGLDPAIPLFRALLRLWNFDAASRPMLAMLCAHARDPLLRLASGAVIGTPIGQVASTKAVLEAVEARAPGRFSQTNLKAIVVRVLGSFVQSGHLTDGASKRRQSVRATPASAAYAAFLAYLEGYRAQRLLTSPWAALLDATPEALVDLLREAGRRGVVSFKHQGNVIDIGFTEWLTPEERELVHEQI